MAIKKIVFVSYGEFDINSAGHIAGFANGLVRRGYGVAVCAGKVESAHAFGDPLFGYFEIQDLLATPEAIIGFGGAVDADQTIILCWTPREVVRRAVEPIATKYGVPYIIHFEDNELHLTETWMRKQDRMAQDPAAARGFRALFHRKKKTPARSVPSYLTDPAKFGPFLAGAAGATVIEERLADLLPPGLPKLVLEPGVDHAELDRASDAYRRAEIRRRLGISDASAMVLYPGNVHWANAGEVGELYRAIGLLRQRGRDVVLVRTGKDAVDADFLSHAGRDTGVITLGQVERPLLLHLLCSADLFVQPGSPGPFNDYRLPSKLPEFLSTGKPVILPATNVGRRLTHGVDAILLREGSAEEIAAGVETVLDDPALAAQLAANAQAFAQRTYSWDRQAGKLAAFLEEIGSSRGGDAARNRYGLR